MIQSCFVHLHCFLMIFSLIMISFHRCFEIWIVARGGAGMVVGQNFFEFPSGHIRTCAYNPACPFRGATHLSRIAPRWAIFFTCKQKHDNGLVNLLVDNASETLFIVQAVYTYFLLEVSSPILLLNNWCLLDLCNQQLYYLHWS